MIRCACGGRAGTHRRQQFQANLRRAALAASLILCGCAALGPRQLPADRFDYGAAIAASTNEQMLLNLVRLRYNETPVFLDVNSVIAQYQFDARAQGAISNRAIKV